MARETGNPIRILVVEDEPKVAASLAEGLDAEGYAATVATTGEDGFFFLKTERFALVILDIMLPGRNGLEILKAARRDGLAAPVLLLTAKDGVDDRVAGLDAGADDYLTKPFAFAELLARARALMRRGSGQGGAQLVVKDLRIDRKARRAERTGRELGLTAKEFELLEYLAERCGRVVSRETLSRDIWRINERATPMDNVIDVHIARLRGKLDGPCDDKLLKTVRGVGFILEG